MLEGEVDQSEPDFSLAELTAALDAIVAKRADNAFTTRDICGLMGLNRLLLRDLQAARNVMRILMAEGKLVYAGKKRQARVDGSLYPFLAYKWTGGGK